MNRYRRVLKAIAVFLALQFATIAIFPGVSLALTAGPTSPEATSFEPVDTTDMVDLVTGDFVYSLPLIEVPGPAGGYPLSLSYHGGIKLNQEASWVGLGWTLNPGAINRSVNGFADDHLNRTGTDRTFWEGGETRTFSIGVTVGHGGSAGVTAGLVYASDTYKGVGIGYYYGMRANEGIGFGKNQVSANFQYQAGVSPYGDRYSSTGLSVGVSKASKDGAKMAASANVGVSFDQNGQASGTASLSIGNFGASISSSGGVGLSAGRFSGSGRVHNSRSGQISTSGYDYSVSIPLKFMSIDLAASYTRYWIDESESVSTNGALYFPTTLPSSSALNNSAFDVYDLQYPDPASETPPDETVAGAFVDYDTYIVTAQGLSGAIRPYHYKAYLLRQNKNNENTAIVKSYPLGVNPTANFRFIGDFSNQYRYDVDASVFRVDPNNTLSFSFDPTKVTGENGNDGFDDGLNRLPGSKHIEWFTNVQINDNERVDENGVPLQNAARYKGFINCKAMGFTRLDDTQIGGIRITNESGVTYHYALPVYSYDEHQYSGRRDEEDRHFFNLYKKPSWYAYTWLLTAVTGPDFVDVNLNGYADESDFGYWVNFEYGLWSRSYSWRNPAVGFNKDVDHNFDMFSKGKKQVYYLNAISTKSHTAFFVKELRADGKGVVHELRDVVSVNDDHEVTDIDNGSFRELEKTDPVSGQTFTEYPVSSLRLHTIYLMENKDLGEYGISDLVTLGNVYYHSQNSTTDLGKYTYGNFVLDIHDLVGPVAADIEAKRLKKIVLNVDYFLSPFTLNSYWSDLDVLNTQQPASGLSGKLTLNSISTYGRTNANLVPDIRFIYDYPKPFYASAEEHTDGEQEYHKLKVLSDFLSMDFQKGDVLCLDLSPRKAYAYVMDVSSSTGELYVKFFFQTFRPIGSFNKPVRFIKTKNAPYREDAYDIWGNFKVDFGAFLDSGTTPTDNVQRMTTSISAKAVDVWSLRAIKTALGATIGIDYEPDVYRSVLKSLSNVPIKNVESVPGGKTKITLYENASEFGLAVGRHIKFRLLTAKRYDVVNPGVNENLRFICNGVESTYTYQWYFDNTYSNYSIPIESVEGVSIIVDYDFSTRYPLMNGSSCLSKSPPYHQEDGGTSQDCIGLDNLIASEPIFVGGEIFGISTGDENSNDGIFAPFGGDLRVRKISLEKWSETRSTHYSYFNGVTSYEPLGIAIPVSRINVNFSSCLVAEQNEAFQTFRDDSFNSIYSKFLALFSNARELPGPGVMYEWVRVSESVERPNGITDIEGRVEYQFEVFSPEKIDLSIPGQVFVNPLYARIAGLSSTGNTSVQSSVGDIVLGVPVDNVMTTNQATKPRIRDFTAIMGSLKRVVYYDKTGLRVNETINHYLHDDFSQSNFDQALNDIGWQGTISETFADARIIRATENTSIYNLHGIVSQRITYPSVQIGQTTINYKTGIQNRVQNIAFDYYSGQSVKVRSEDGYGNAFISETIPAYRKYDEMGFGYQGHKNMLTQVAGTLDYKLADDGTKTIVSASAITWSNDIPIVINPALTQNSPVAHNVWRPQSTFTWKGDDVPLVDGLYPWGSFSAFDFSNPSVNSTQWQKVSEVTLSDKYSHVLEAVDINGNYGSIRMSSDQELVLASASNAGYIDFAYSGAEDDWDQGWLGGNVKVNQDRIVDNPIFAHTGRKSLHLSPNNVGFIFDVVKTNIKNSSHTYHASVWVREETADTLPSVALIAEIFGGAILSSATPQTKYKAGNWYLIQLDFSLPTSNDLVRVYVKNTSSGSFYYVDDFRAHPTNSSVTGYVYNDHGQLSHILDDNNLYTEFQYDALGRLIGTVRETFKYGDVKTSEVLYHYAGQPENQE